MSLRLSRRGFARLVGASVTAAALPGGRDRALALATAPPPSAAATVDAVVRLSANENPYGPPPQSLAAIHDGLALACRYPDAQAEALQARIARMHAIDARQVLLGDGSSEILKLAVAACTSPDRPLVMADPTFEAVAHYAEASGAPVVKVPLTAAYRHDLARMRYATAVPGLVYVCNPNNPTASVTPAAEILAFLDVVPPTTTVLVDEAYHHFASGGGYATVAGEIARRPNLMVARTFSKIYGMAGLRCGYGIAQPELVDRMRRHAAWDTMNVVSLVAATAALDADDYVESSRARNTQVRQETCDALAARGLHVIPSQANFFMVDIHQPVGPVIAALRARGVEVGRRFPALPSHLRVTVGKREEMQAFLAALAKVMPAAA